jgi:hypothetical protein
LRRVIVYVVGPSDQLIVPALLRDLIPLAREAGVSFEPPRLPSAGVGGDDRLLWEVPRLAEIDLRSPGVAAVFALMDSHLPGEKSDPVLERLRAAGRSRLTCDQRERFHAHVASPEIEAWLLADEKAVTDYLAGFGVKVSKRWPRPEELSDAKAEFDKLFMRARRPRLYMATTDGPLIAQRVRPEIVAKKCPRFRAFVEDLRNTAGLSG